MNEINTSLPKLLNGKCDEDTNDDDDDDADDDADGQNKPYVCHATQATQKSALLNSNVRASEWVGRRRASSEVCLFVNLLSKLYITFSLQWIAFIFGRNEEEDL